MSISLDRILSTPAVQSQEVPDNVTAVLTASCATAACDATHLLSLEITNLQDMSGASIVISDDLISALKGHDTMNGTLPASLTDTNPGRNPSVNRYQVLLTVILREAKKLYQKGEKESSSSGEAVDSARLRTMLDAVNDAACLRLTPDYLLSLPVISRLAKSLPFGHANPADITILKTTSSYDVEDEKTLGMSADGVELMMRTPGTDTMNRKFGACLQQAQKVVNTIFVINFQPASGDFNKGDFGTLFDGRRYMMTPGGRDDLWKLIVQLLSREGVTVQLFGRAVLALFERLLSEVSTYKYNYDSALRKIMDAVDLDAFLRVAKTEVTPTKSDRRSPDSLSGQRNRGSGQRGMYSTGCNFKNNKGGGKGSMSTGVCHAFHSGRCQFASFSTPCRFPHVCGDCRLMSASSKKICSCREVSRQQHQGWGGGNGNYGASGQAIHTGTYALGGGKGPPGGKGSGGPVAPTGKGNHYGW